MNYLSENCCSQNILKNHKFTKITDFRYFRQIHRNRSKSPPGGNQVDGLPPDQSTGLKIQNKRQKLSP